MKLKLSQKVHTCHAYLFTFLSEEMIMKCARSKYVSKYKYNTVNWRATKCCELVIANIGSSCDLKNSETVVIAYK